MTNADSLRAIERAIEGMTDEQRDRLLSLPGVDELRQKKWIPNNGPQRTAYYSQADELFYGGSAGGGKSDLGMGLAVNEHYSSLLLRRTNKEASKFIKRLSEIIGTRDGWNGQLSTFTLPDGRIIETGGCQLEDDKQKYKGDPHSLIFFDEISDFSESQYRFISGWNRSTRKGERCRIVCAGNPPTRPEGMWVVRHWAAWLDPNYKSSLGLPPAQEGELRWYTNRGGEDVECIGPGPHYFPGEEKGIIARSRTFIRARLEDNIDLEESGYDSVLAGLPDGLRQAYREGRFDIAIKDDEWQVIPTEWVLQAQARWKPDGWKGLRMTAMGLDPAGGGGDPAALCWRYGHWFSEVTEVKGPDSADGSAMGALVVRYRKDGAPVVVDVGGGYAGAVIERFKDNDLDFRRFDGSRSTGERARGSSLQFQNKRAEAWWRMREALDPDQEGGCEIALPPDHELRAELCAPRYSLGSNGIRLELKDSIRDRIGRSPNRGDAMVICNSEGWIAQERQLRRSTRRPRVIVGYDRQKMRSRDNRQRRKQANG